MSNQEQDFDQSGNDEVIVASGLVDSDLEDSTQETLDSSELVESTQFVESTEANDDELGYQPCSLGAKISALLFVSSRPLSVEALAEAANVRVESVEREIPKVQERFLEDIHGFSLVEIAGGWQFRTNPGAAPSIQRLIPKSARKLSRAAAETLAVIAYRQPVQRAEIETIRGVDALPTLKTLLDARLIRIVGRSDAAGACLLYTSPSPRDGLLSRMPSSA